MSSILNDVKHVLGVPPSVDSFDTDIVMHINSVFATLAQLGVGVPTGFEITGFNEEWSDFTSEIYLNSVKSYVYLKVKLMFDPPQTGFTTSAIERQIQELEFRLQVAGDTTWVLPTDVTVDGGTV